MTNIIFYKNKIDKKEIDEFVGKLGSDEYRSMLTSDLSSLFICVLDKSCYAKDSDIPVVDLVIKRAASVGSDQLNKYIYMLQREESNEANGSDIIADAIYVASKILLEFSHRLVDKKIIKQEEEILSFASNTKPDKSLYKNADIVFEKKDEKIAIFVLDIMNGTKGIKELEAYLFNDELCVGKKYGNKQIQIKNTDLDSFLSYISDKQNDMPCLDSFIEFICGKRANPVKSVDNKETLTFALVMSLVELFFDARSEDSFFFMKKNQNKTSFDFVESKKIREKINSKISKSMMKNSLKCNNIQSIYNFGNGFFDITMDKVVIFSVCIQKMGDKHNVTIYIDKYFLSDCLYGDSTLLIEENGITKAMIRMPKKGSFTNKKMSASGKVVYDYGDKNKTENKPETNSGTDEEPAVDIRKEFESKVIKADNELVDMFADNMSNVPDIVVVGVLLGLNSVAFFDDTSNYFNYLNANDEQRADDIFAASTGTYGVISGKIGYNSFNFPDSASFLMKKIVMMHEIGHAFYYGCLRHKHKRYFGNEGFAKMFINNMNGFVKFVESFEEQPEEDGKEITKKAMVNNAEEDVQKQYVSAYAQLNQVEKFAEDFSYYFVAPDVLYKNDPETYGKFHKMFSKFQKGNE